jgi:hypothetical protein
VFYDLQSIGKPSLEEVVEGFLLKQNLKTQIEELVE